MLILYCGNPFIMKNIHREKKGLPDLSGQPLAYDSEY